MEFRKRSVSRCCCRWCSNSCFETSRVLLQRSNLADRKLILRMCIRIYWLLLFFEEGVSEHNYGVVLYNTRKQGHQGSYVNCLACQRFSMSHLVSWWEERWTGSSVFEWDSKLTNVGNVNEEYQMVRWDKYKVKQPRSVRRRSFSNVCKTVGRTGAEYYWRREQRRMRKSKLSRGR